MWRRERGLQQRKTYSPENTARNEQRSRIIAAADDAKTGPQAEAQARDALLAKTGAQAGRSIAVIRLVHHESGERSCGVTAKGVAHAFCGGGVVMRESVEPWPYAERYEGGSRMRWVECDAGP